ncbi:MAG: hypothetical protein RI995_224 [Bacteroidota bacterium]|jgi:NADH-quinone oxidoreductase subunit L
MNSTLIFSELALLPWITAAIMTLFIKQKSSIVSWFSVASSATLLGFILQFTIQQTSNFQLNIHWFTIGNKVINASFHLDSISKAMLCLVGLVSLMVQVFSLSYMKKEAHINRYFIFLQLFVGSMIGLLIADQLWMFYGFWELVGACSFFIISFWHQKDTAIRAAKKAFLLNRIGDLALLIGLFLVAQHFQTDRFSSMNISQFGPLGLLAGLTLVIGASGKSAQFPLMSWLPDAMEGPTPASALIHAATMVTAGVFLAMRVYPITGEETHLAFGIIGGISFLSAAVFALFQRDIKKTLAYSTISQIGLMWMGLGSDASLFHLLTHGIFKAGLFLSAGAIIHYLHHQDKQHQIDPQNVQTMGGLFTKIPGIAILYIIFTLGLIGLPLTNGFFSKENIAGFLIEQSEHSAFHAVYLVLLGVLAFGIALSTLYSSRQAFLIFGGKNRSNLSFETSKIDFLQIFPLILLGLASTWLIVDVNPLAIQDSKILDFLAIHPTETPHFWLMISMGLWLTGLTLAYLSRNKIPSQTFQFWKQFWPSINQLGLDIAQIIQHKIDQQIDYLIHCFTRLQVILAHGISWIDRWIVDGILVKGSTKFSYLWGGVLSKWQSGQVQSYWTWVTITFGLFLLYYIL